MKKVIAGVLLTSFLLQPLGLVSPALAETVEMEYTDPEHLHAPKVVEGVEYQYDANGNLVNDGERVIEWNQDNMPTRIEKDGKVVEFFYDANGRRVVKKSDQRTQTYVDVRYQPPSKYYFANGRTAQSVDDNLTYLHQDHLGSTILATDSNSQVLGNTLSYLPYGSLVNNLTIQQFNNYLFTGQELDPESDFYNYNARLYNPKIGAFISADTVGSGNRYAYAANNPLIFTDPTGHMIVNDGGGGGAPANDPDDVLQYEISGGGNNYQPPGITATDVINLEPTPLPPGNPEDFPKLIMGMAAFSSAAVTAVLAVPATVAYLTFLYNYYYYNYFYSAPAEPAATSLRIPVGDTMWMESATGETLSPNMSEEAWEEVYQASKMMTEEYGVRVYDEVPDAVLNPPWVELKRSAVYKFREGVPGDIFIDGGLPARERVLRLGHEWKHFLYDWSSGFPGSFPKSSTRFTEFDAYRLDVANRHIFPQGELGPVDFMENLLKKMVQ